MARPKIARPPEQTDGIADANVNHAALEQAGADAAQLGQHIAIIESAYGDDYPYDLYRLETRARDIKTVIAGAAWELGCIFVRIRAHVDRGEFLASLGRMGYTPRWAQKCMQAVQKFSGSPQRQLLAQQLSQSKLIELLTEDDDTLDDLVDGGTLASLTLDEVDRMSARELKTALRKERKERSEEAEATEELVRKKDEKINRLARRSTRSGTREQVSTLLEDLDRYSVEALTFLKQVHDTIGAINTMYSEAGEAIDEEVQQRIETNVESVNVWHGELIALVGE